MESASMTSLWKNISTAAVTLFLFALASAAPSYAAQGFVTYVIHGEDGGITENVPVTFGAIFVKGDVPPGSSVTATDGNGNPLTLQVDVKAKHPDGSLRHAVLTVIAPHLANGADLTVALSRGPKSESAPLPLTSLPNGFDTVLALTMKDGRQLHASARDLLNKTKPELWLSGSQTTEWWVSAPLRDALGKADPYLSARFGIRSYGAGQPVRVEVVLENTWMFVPGPRTEFYDAKITANGKTAFEQAGMIQPTYTRWRQVFWWDRPVAAYVEQNLDYLKKSRIIPNYKPDTDVSKDDIARLYDRYQKVGHAPLEAGIITPYMPTTGGRGDIAPLPAWTTDYLLTMDRHAYELTVGSGDLAGSFAAHYRSTQTKRPFTTEEFPNLSTHSNFVGRPGNLELPDTGGFKSPLVPQRAHEPSLAFIPYVVTGDRYYLEELEFWSQWNSVGTDPAKRDHKAGLVTWDEVRAQAWSLRTLAQAAYIAPETDPLKPVLLRELKSNIDHYNDVFVNNPNANVLHAAFGGSKHAEEFSPWMDDYLTWSVGYVVQLGFENARPFAQWKAYYPVQRMINKDYCWMLATPYRMEMQYPDLSTVRNWADAYKMTFTRFAKKKVDPASVACGSDEMADVMGTKPGEMLSGFNPGGYPANLQPALAAAVDMGVPGAQEAWDKFLSVKRKSGFYSQWAIVPYAQN